MKKLIKVISENKFQFFFFLGLSAMLLGALVIGKTVTPSNDPIVDTPNIDEPSDNPGNTDTPNVNVKPVEVFKLPFDEAMDYQVVRKFYEKDASVADQEKALIKYNNSYRVSNGTSYANKDNSVFDVRCVFSGKVVEIKESPLYGKYVVLEHNNDIKTYYYGLSEVTVTVGSTVDQSDKIGVSGQTEIDSASGIHVFLKVTKDGKFLNPEKIVGKKLTDI